MGAARGLQETPRSREPLLYESHGQIESRAGVPLYTGRCDNFNFNKMMSPDVVGGTLKRAE